MSRNLGYREGKTSHNNIFFFAKKRNKISYLTKHFVKMHRLVNVRVYICTFPTNFYKEKALCKHATSSHKPPTSIFLHHINQWWTLLCTDLAVYTTTSSLTHINYLNGNNNIQQKQCLSPQKKQVYHILLKDITLIYDPNSIITDSLTELAEYKSVFEGLKNYYLKKIFTQKWLYFICGKIL